VFGGGREVFFLSSSKATHSRQDGKKKKRPLIRSTETQGTTNHHTAADGKEEK
jgi:hypothetical protein